MSKTSASMMAVFLAVVVVIFAVAEGQSSTPNCASELVSCAGDLNSTATPSQDCCSAITRVVTTQLSCLCNLVNNPSALAGINMTQALDIPRRCGLSTDTSACRTAAATPGSSPGGRQPGGTDGNNGVGTIAWSAMPALLFLWAISSFF